MLHVLAGESDLVSRRLEAELRVRWGDPAGGLRVLTAAMPADPVQSITALRVDQMCDYFARRYSPANIVLAVAGKTDWEEVLALAQSHCGPWQGEPASRSRYS